MRFNSPFAPALLAALDASDIDTVDAFFDNVSLHRLRLASDAHATPLAEFGDAAFNQGV